MDVKDILEEIKKNGKFRELSKNGYYISSVFVTLTSFDEKPAKWHVHCFAPKSGEMATFYFDGEVGFECISKPLTEIEINRLRPEKISVGFAEALKISKNEIEVPACDIVRILVTLHNLTGSEEVWSVNVVTKLFKLYSINISAELGGIVSKTEDSLLKIK